MTTGLDIRAQIDTENVKGLLLVNGGAAVALLAFLPTVLDKPTYEPLARAVLWGVLIFQIGLLFAIFHNRLRRICSLKYEQHNYQPAPCRPFGTKLAEPCVCYSSIIFMWLSVTAFGLGGLTVLLGGLESLDQRAMQTQEPAASSAQKVKVPSNNTVEMDARKNGARPSR